MFPHTLLCLFASLHLHYLIDTMNELIVHSDHNGHHFRPLYKADINSSVSVLRCTCVSVIPASDPEKLSLMLVLAMQTCQNTFWYLLCLEFFCTFTFRCCARTPKESHVPNTVMRTSVGNLKYTCTVMVCSLLCRVTLNISCHFCYFLLSCLQSFLTMFVIKSVGDTK